MAQRSFLGDMLTTLFERRDRTPARGDARSLDDLCRALLDAEGEVSGLALAQTILDRYATLSETGKVDFFAFLNSSLEIDMGALGEAILRYDTSGELGDYRRIGALAEPRRQELLRRLNQTAGATEALVRMREDLLGAVRAEPDLARTDIDFQHLLKSWFNRGFLVLRQINWETPASILEKIVEYEAVHAIGDWDDLRRRLYPDDRRCFAYFHPSMPDEPLIFVEVALTMSVPGSVQHLLADDREVRRANDTKVAVFYSISNCQKGLTGISFGNLLIKQVVSELQAELPGIETFVTLSPLPGFVQWLRTRDDGEAKAVLDGDAAPGMVEGLAADYLVNAKGPSGAPLDPVARFHLGNGAQIHAVHADADLSANGIDRSRGAMVNYEYDLALIEQNHEKFVSGGEVATTQEFRAVVAAASKRRKRTDA